MVSTRKTLEKLFISKVRIKALRYFLFNYDQAIHLREAVRTFNEEINAVRRELERLESIKFLEVERKGNRKYFQVNKNHPYFEELLPFMHKAYGLGGDIITNLPKLGRIDYAFLTSNYTKGYQGNASNKVDLLLIGDVALDQLAELVHTNEQKLKREIHYTVLKFSEFNLRKKRRDNFVMDVLIQPKIMLVGSVDALCNLNS